MNQRVLSMWLACVCVVLVALAALALTLSSGPRSSALNFLRRTPYVNRLVPNRGIGPVNSFRPAAGSIPRPNVLLISLDTVRADHLGLMGYSRPTTPNLDRFARQAMVFTNCRSQAPWTLPSHMSLFTSMLPSSSGVDNLNTVLRPEVTTLAEVLHEAGYRTAALVNNGQMRAHWGFDRGFDTWRELEVDTPEGDCEHITAEALDWLRKNQPDDKPFFLFLHYYDAHDPYFAAEAFRKQMGATLSGDEARALVFEHRTPELNFTDNSQLEQVIRAYDAELAWLDSEVGRLLRAVPPNTLVVIFSDHGEAFEEHGWTAHGATLYEEEIHVPLIVRLPSKDRSPRRIDKPVTLLDVAPTILSACGIRQLPQSQGSDLFAAAAADPQRPRLVPSETKAVLEGRACWSLVVYPLKIMYSLFDRRVELYKLPDEKTDLARSDPKALEALLGPLEAWVNSEQFWILTAAGSGDYEIAVESKSSPISLFIPAGIDPERDNLDLSPDGRILKLHVYGNSERPKHLLIRPADPNGQLVVDVKIDGASRPTQVWIGKDRTNPVKLPAMLGPDMPSTPAFSIEPLKLTGTGVYVQFQRAVSGSAATSRFGTLDPHTIEQLRSLGYVQ